MKLVVTIFSVIFQTLIITLSVCSIRGLIHYFKIRGWKDAVLVRGRITDIISDSNGTRLCELELDNGERCRYTERAPKGGRCRMEVGREGFWRKKTGGLLMESSEYDRQHNSALQNFFTVIMTSVVILGLTIIVMIIVMIIGIIVQ